MATSVEGILATVIAAATPFRVWTFIIFALAIFHTLWANHFTSLAKRVEENYAKKKGSKNQVSFLAEVLFFFGEIEVVFALWLIPLMIVVTVFYDWAKVIEYLNTRVYVEPFFIVVMMSLASTRPIIKLAQTGVHAIAKLLGDTPLSWWLVILSIGPILGSLITEAAAMTIAALLLKEKIYVHRPSKRLAYGTLGLMFVNFSVGGMLTNFAAPPALTLSRCWNWNLGDFWGHFGFPVIVGIGIVNTLYFVFLRGDFKKLKKLKRSDLESDDIDKKKGQVPIWITFIHLIFLSWTIAMAHYPPIFLGSYLLFLGFHQATRHHQYNLNLKRPLMVGLFLAGLVIHGGFQGWWIEPLLGDLAYGAMMFTGAVLTAFNENTTVAYLGCLVGDLQPKIQYALASGLIGGGGLTVIAHSPNPAAQALLRPFFKRGISPWNLFLSAIIPTTVFLAIFYFFPSL